MKFNIIIFLFLGLVGSIEAQSRKEKKDMKFYNDVFSIDDFEKHKAPEKWANESYIYLAVQTYVTLNKGYYSYRGFNRKRILLHDQKAVEDFAEFYFQKSETVYITITKKSGKEVIVNTDEAIEVTTDVPAKYATRFQSSTSYKLAISNLEIGDIIDFTNIFNSTYRFELTYSELLNFEKPVVYQNVTFDVPTNHDVNCSTYNTSAKVKEYAVGSGFNSKGEKDEDFKRYEIVTGELEGYNDEKFKNTMTFEPIAKFMALDPKVSLVAGDKDVHKEIISVEDMLMKMLVRRQYYLVDYNMPFSQMKYLYNNSDEDNKKDLKTSSQIATKFYYDMREILIEGERPVNSVAKIKGKLGTFESIYGGNSKIVEPLFITFFTKFLDSKDIDYNIVAFAPNYLGGIKNAKTFDELYFGVYVTDAKEYFFPPSRNTNHRDIPMGLSAGAEGLSLSSVGYKDDPKFKDVKLSNFDYLQNYDHDSLRVKLDLSNNCLDVYYALEAAGTNKDYYRNLLQLFGPSIYSDYLEMYYVKYLTEEFDKYKEMSKGKQAEIYADLTKKSLEVNKKAIMGLITNDDESIESKITFKSLKVEKNGRTFLNPYIKLNYSYNDQRYISKLGPNYIVEVGKLIGSQYVVEEKDKMERKSGIYNRSPRHLQNTIELEIPDGYKVADITALNKSFGTDVFSFESKAEIKGNILYIRTLKYYKETILPKESWTDFVKMLDEAYQFSQEKIILKKA